MNIIQSLDVSDFSLDLRKISLVEVYKLDTLFLLDDVAFEHLFKTHFNALHAYANVTLRDEEQAEEIVQGVFIKLWEKRELLNIDTSVKAYLYRCVHNECLNYIKRSKVKSRYEEHVNYSGTNYTESAAKPMELKELEWHIQEALSELPQQCRTIFQMSRFEELKYKEIAEQLNLSVKTIENQMGKALKLMRAKLRDFLPLFLILLNSWL